MNKVTTKPWRVDVFEYERGWGSKFDESFYFDTFEEAGKYMTDYNTTHNPPGPVPDWYMVAMDPVRQRVS